MTISETVRAEISVLAEVWGERETLAPRVLRCPGDGRPGRLQLIEHDDGAVSGTSIRAGQDLADLILVPWIACTGCDQILMRAHAQKPWGDLSYLARHYVIVSSDRATALRVFPADSADGALAALLDDCRQSPSTTSSMKSAP
ncbi:hypothetical protein [Streptomyces atratus]|uniref:hypothetical protein n=1 Tax=Streptomyces atratus TaxID=1893 RepID=UPI00224DB5CB|nr:hypothetical protein [Streptomyces atratus]MCX5341361.1 hypothetical protein [Streptomyces atratus]